MSSHSEALAALLARLDADQSAFVDTLVGGAGNLQTRAGAGSGKTTASVAGIGALIESGVPASEIVATTFTSKAGKEFHERLAKVVAPATLSQLRVGTFHGLGLRSSKNAGKGFDMGLCLDTAGSREGSFSNDKRETLPSSRQLWSKVLGWDYVPGLNEKGLNIDLEQLGKSAGDYQMAADVLRSRGIEWNDAGAREAARSIEEAKHLFSFYDAWWLVEQAKRALGAWDFADVLSGWQRALASGRCKDSAQVVIVDEAQDCQPPGTMVSLPGGRVLPIEQIKEGDTVQTYNMTGLMLAMRGRKVDGVRARMYSGRLATVACGGQTTRFTPEHHCIVHVGPALAGKSVLYLMRRGASYRLGVTQAVHGKGHGVSGLAGRLHGEGGDAIWVLDTFASRGDALLAERLASHKFGIPDLVFSARNVTGMGMERLSTFWSSVGSLEASAKRCLDAFGRDIRYPLLETAGKTKRYLLQNRATTIRAANLLPGMLMLSATRALSEGKRRVKNGDSSWLPISVEWSDYAGPVYSLSVKDHHTYVADGIVTHNCSWVQLELGKLLAKNGNGRLVLVGDSRQAIYGWRGAAPSIFSTFDVETGAQVCDLASNYRSGSSIVAVGNAVAEGKAWSVGSASVARRDLTGTVSVIGGAADPMDEASEVARRIAADVSEGSEPSQYAVLVRTNAMSGPFEAELVKARVPVVVVGGVPFFRRADVQDVVAYATLIQHDSLDALDRVCNKPKRYLGKAFMENLRSSYKVGESVVDAVRNLAPSLRGSSARGALELAATIEELRALGWVKPTVNGEEKESGLDRLVAILRPKLANGDGSDSDDDARGVLASAVSVAKTFESAQALLDFAALCGAQVKGTSAEVGEEALRGRVTISTIHKAKGLEFENVFVSASQGVFPHRRSLDDPDRMEEEERLFYVAVTRARDSLCVTWSEENLYGQPAGPSQFHTFVEPNRTDEREVPRDPDGGGSGVRAPRDRGGDAGPPTGSGGGRAPSQPAAAGQSAVESGGALVASGARPAAHRRGGAPDGGEACTPGASREDLRGAEWPGALGGDACEDVGGTVREEVGSGAGASGEVIGTGPHNDRGAPERSSGDRGAASSEWDGVAGDRGNAGCVSVDARTPSEGMGLVTARRIAEDRTEAEPRSTGTGEGSRYVEVLAPSFEELLSLLGFSEGPPKNGQRVWSSNPGHRSGVYLSVYSTIPTGGTTAREVGEDSIRVAALFDVRGGKTLPVLPKLEWVCRTRGWRVSLLDRIEKLDALLATLTRCPTCGAPMARREGPRGPFMGCRAFPTCSTTLPLTSTSQPGEGGGSPSLAGLHPEGSPGAQGTSGVRR